MNRKKEIIYLLSREQEVKKAFLQLGNQKNLPRDIILLLYNHLRYQSQKDTEIVRNYHLTNLYQITLLPNPLFPLSEFESSSLRCRNRRKARWRSRAGKGPEWGIKSSIMLPLRFKGFRICILEKIKIIGEKDYLYEKDYENNKLKDATLLTKLNYINNSLFHVLRDDYNIFINNNNIFSPKDYCIFIDNYGVGTVFWNLAGGHGADVNQWYLNYN